MKKLLVLLTICLMAVGANAKGNRAFVYYYDQQYGLYDYFIQRDNTNWDEMHVLENKLKFKFITISDDKEQTIIHDLTRNNYIRLTSTQCFVGNNKDNATRKLYDGYWVRTGEGPTAAEMLEKNTNIFLYEKKQCRGFFMKSGKEWKEYDYSNGILLNTYTITEQKSDYILLYCSRGGFYIKLTDNGCYYNTSPQGDFTVRYCGRWSLGSLSGEPRKKTGGNRSHKDEAFAYYLEGKTNSYFGYFMQVSSGQWEEIRVSDEKVLYKYRFVSESGGAMILYDESRSVYVRVTESELFWGSTKEDITHKIYDGAWVGFDYGYSVSMVLELDINIFIFEYTGFSGYYSRSDEGYWLEYAATGGRPVNTFTIIEETNTYIIMYCGKCGYYIKLTEDGSYYSNTKDGPYTKQADGKWSQGKVQNGPATKKPTAAKSNGGGVSADPLVALKNHVRDSVTKLMKLPNLTNKAITDKKVDKKNLETVAADVARQYLATLKKNALKKFNGKTIKISAYDKQKQVYTLVWNSDIFNISVPLAESEAFKTNWSKMTFADPDYYFDGTKFRLSALKITNTVLKKTYTYDVRNQKRAAPSIKVGDLDVALPGN